MKIKIEKIVYPGKSLGRGEDGIAVFTEGGLPGETVEVTVTKSRKSFKEARLEAVLEPSADRIQAECPSFSKCGGCTFQHVSYQNQLKIKQAYTGELIAPFGFGDINIIPSPEEWGYRNKMEFSFFDEGKGLMLGLHKKGEFAKYFPIPPCLISDKDLINVFEIVLAYARKTGLVCYDKRDHTGFYRHLVLRKSKGTGQVLVNLVTNAKEDVGPELFKPLADELAGKAASFYWTINTSVSDAVNVDKLILISGAENIEEIITVKDRKYSFLISPFSFFQTNTHGAEKLYELAIDMLEPKDTDSVLDLYCGTGTIGIVVAPFVKAVFGVEQVEAAILDAEKNKVRNKIENISFAAGSVEKWVKTADKPHFNAVILDPPRGGISTKVVKYIAELKPDKIVYVSCNPSTLARDLALLKEPGYTPRKAVAVDMFPHTYHIETIVSLTH
jgi:23S rRNA (uracil-5-)-methyltransferase RumA